MAFDIQTLERMLREAELALHEAQLGRKTRRVKDQSGVEVEFSVTNTDKLEAYIAKLEVQIGRLRSGHPAATGPIRFVFG